MSDSVNVSALRELSQDELRVGDKVLVMPRKIEDMDYVMQVKTSNGDVETGEDYYNPEHYRFLLAHRPIPELPFKVGSVVNVSKKSANTSSRWMLNSAGYWNSDQGGSRSKESFAGFIQENLFEVEVIA